MDEIFKHKSQLHSIPRRVVFADFCEFMFGDGMEPLEAAKRESELFSLSDAHGIKNLVFSSHFPRALSYAHIVDLIGTKSNFHS